LEAVDLAGAVDLYCKSCDMLCPTDTPPHEMGNCPVISLEMFRSYFKCLILLKGPHESLIPVANKMIDLFQGFGSDSSLCKMMLTVTLLELHGGDVVRAENTFLNSHLNNAVYIKSKECEVADLFVLAFKRQDITKLDEAKTHMQLNYLDSEIQPIARNLSLFRTRSDYKPPQISESAPVTKSPPIESAPHISESAPLTSESPLHIDENQNFEGDKADHEGGDNDVEGGEDYDEGLYDLAPLASYTVPPAASQEEEPVFEDEIDLS
jgi:hypothetical protein